ncbi:NAD(P)/FAD-dependent oxidoreductase [Haloterrigena sp. SYSU A121-1]|uniref:NAD(P)/FAD-dependent oxidoreductase n=1 Tax=Haloterrigena gelatinilytica TaxID=2741724 RepID=A0A8J8KH89_9EURY|nr:NAD(P)/FAD-dependent oxidoreductase [Haloterrigena gelatinilytica]NUB90914.1 NAD(P)/FAD-dependent oxidoreductase [Haloterrigena gelatinilytica]
MADGADTDAGFDVDVAVVGGGPAGCSAGVFAARYGLETVVFDRGSSSLRRCACLENYLGFPCGIDAERFLELAQTHAREAGCRIREELVDSVVALAGNGEIEDAADSEGFRLETQGGDPVTARFVIAATKYDGSYLRGLDDDEALFVTEEGADGSVERFDRAYPDDDGRTPVAGLYVAGPLAGSGDQAIIAAGHGATVARTLLRDLRREEGYWDRFAKRYDWRRYLENRDEEWADPERWVELFDETAPEDRDAGDVRRLAESYAAERDESYLEAETAARRTERGQRRLADALDDEVLLEAVDDEAIRERAAALEGGNARSDADPVDD